MKGLQTTGMGGWFVRKDVEAEGPLYLCKAGTSLAECNVYAQTKLLILVFQSSFRSCI